jgi:antirestriction protein ArdC
MRNPRANRIDWQSILIEAVEKPGIISKAYSTFWNYSVGNQLAALFQCMLRGIEPGPIHTYKAWQELGRQVKKGEKAIVLTMPLTVSDKATSVKANDASPSSIPPNSPATKRRIFVERPHWFVLSQTEGKEYAPLQSPEWNEANALRTLLIGRVPFRHLDGNCQGYAVLRQVAVSPIAFLPHRTLFHEVAHVVLGHTEESQTMTDDDGRTPRDIREVEAECVALICSESLGMPGAEFSRGYIQHWLKSNSIPEKSVHRIFKAAEAILRAGRPVESADPSSTITEEVL